MKKSVALLFSLILIASSALAVLPALAEERTIVVPDNYPTLETAIANAHNGDTILVKKGIYEGPINQTITIDKTISIVGEGMESTMINLHPAYNSSWILTQQFFDFSDAITITADGCKLYNLTLAAKPGGAISAIGDRTQLMGNNITTEVLVNGSYSKILDNACNQLRLNGSFNEIFGNTANYIYVEGPSNAIKDNMCQGLSLSLSANSIVSSNKVWSDSWGYSGISLSNCTNNIISNNDVSGFSSGFRIWFSSDNIITANIIENSLTNSFNFGYAFNNKIYHNNIINKEPWTLYVYDNYADPPFRGNFPNMTVSSNIWDNGTAGNYWGNYNGTDLNGDGIGDTPYVMKTAFFVHGEEPSELVCGRDNFPLMKPVDIRRIVNEIPVPTPSPTPTPTTSLPSTPSTGPQTSELKENQPFPTTTVLGLSCLSIGSIAVCLLYFYKKRFKPLI